MDNSELPHQETLARLYELRALLDTGAEVAAMRLPHVDTGAPCDDCGLHEGTKAYGRVTVCHGCAVSRLEVAAALLCEPA